MRLGGIDTAIIVAYLAGMLAVGLYVARRIGGFADWFVAGRRMTTPVLACTLVSTYYGLDVTFGSSETAYLEGMAAFFAYSAPFYLAYLATAILVAPRIRALPVLSLPEAMGHFYGRPARLATAIASFFYSAPILAVAGMGLIGELAFGWSFATGAMAGAAFALVYTVLGGLWAAALTDTVQFVLMCVSIAAAAVVVLLRVGPPEAIGERLGPEVLAPFGELGLGEILVFAGAALTPLVEPAFYQRTFAAHSGKQVVRALLIGLVLWIAYDWIVVYLGVAGRDLVASGALPADLDESAILLHVAAEVLPVGLLGLFLAGCLAAAMSTIDSYTMIAAGNIVYDAWPAVRGTPLSDRTLLQASRMLTVVTLAISVALALRFDRLRDAWIFMATLLLSTALVPMMAALFLRRRPPARAGQIASVLGLAAAVLFFAAFEVLGHDLEAEGTRALHLELGGVSHGMQREETLLVTLPLALLGFLWGVWRAPRARATP